jgi:hypothetical protein
MKRILGYKSFQSELHGPVTAILSRCHIDDHEGVMDIQCHWIFEGKPNTVLTSAANCRDHREVSAINLMLSNMTLKLVDSVIGVRIEEITCRRQNKCL